MNYQTKPGTPEELVHFGVKGMHWGVRTNRDSGGGGSSTKKSSSPTKSAKPKLTEQQTAAAALIRRQRNVKIAKVAATSAAVIGARLALYAITGLPTASTVRVRSIDELTPEERARYFG